MGRAHEVRKASMAKSAAAKSALNGRAAKEIYMAAKNGVADPNANLALRSAIDKAKSKQIPSDVIKRAIDRAAGGDAEAYVSNRYEGYGPGSTAIIVDSLTSNVNRAIAEIRDAFNKNGGKLGQNGSVSHMFNATSIFEFEGKTLEETLEYLMEKEVEVNDVIEDNGNIIVYAPFSSFSEVKQALDEFGIKNYKTAETIMTSENKIIVNDTEELSKFEKLLNKLNELEDVQAVYHNADLYE
ncbi:YebC/PmpR family DNA-binding transcriptional regulator [Spiroplasma endosymbiont of Labia minor]|uniref:YebC/PmpR family DNA-binding transcriptional regulator n=1 Tax=Spiroplasma endosymbiont of Labia minor TaxID=3066305 RepID=UPI0030D33B85